MTKGGLTARFKGVTGIEIAISKRTGKPILLITAAAQCGGVPGMW